ncbi:hypothetical protein BGW42_006281 [Actinomortierella wolfii]|nr:hypothetical protein BGW42_006281 [Actinomortierella wolfii]
MSANPIHESASSPKVGSPRLTPSLGDHLVGSSGVSAAISHSTSSPSIPTAAGSNNNATTANVTSTPSPSSSASSTSSSTSPSSSAAAMSSSAITVVGGTSNHSGSSSSSGLLSASSNSTSATSIATTNHSTSGKGSFIPTGSSTLGLGNPGVSDTKLKKFQEHNQRLREQLEMHRITVSEASQGLIKYVTTTRDALIPSLWGMPSSDPFSKKSSGCCTIC